MLSPIAWRTPPRHYSPWERVVALLTEGLVRKGIDVTLFATADSETSGRLHAVVPSPYEEDKNLDPKVWECLHISELFETADDYDLIHNHLDFLPLSYCRLVQTPVVTTIHGFSSPKILPVYRKYNGKVFYVSISNADRSPDLSYIATIYHGIDIESFTFEETADDHLLFLGGVHRDKGTREAIEIALRARKKIILAGIVQDKEYFSRDVEPLVDGEKVIYVGSVGPGKRDELLGRSVALLHPVQFEEPFGLSVVEANACGTPVIAFPRGSLPEIITQGLNGFLVSDISEAVDAVSRIKQISRLECRRVVQERFSCERMVEEYLKIYDQIVSQTKREDHRPWGYYQVLSDASTHKVKRIVVFPRKRLSLQAHRQRSEHWMILSGMGVVTRDNEEIPVKAGDAVDIPLGCRHRISNIGKEEVVFIEIQTGDYFGEDDIERFEDDYGRV